MGRLIVKSFLKDIKNFINMVPYRMKKIEAASDEVLPETYGVNELSAELHPNNQRVIVADIKSIGTRIKLITLLPEEGAELAFFRPGQGVNIKVENEFSFFPIVSAPDNKSYTLAVYSENTDKASEFLFNSKINYKIDISGPTGLFYYSPLRDGNSIVLVCDIYGLAPVLSICRYLSTRDASVNVLLLDGEEKSYGAELFSDIKNIDLSVLKSTDEINDRLLEEFTAPSAFFVGGQHSFCEEIKRRAEKSPMLKSRVRLFIADPPVAYQELSAERYSCQAIYRDEEFSFDCFGNETLLSAFERNSIPTQAKCKVGECGYCRCKLLEGEVETILCNDIDSRRSADEKYSFIHPCRAFPKTDIKVKL